MNDTIIVVFSGYNQRAVIAFLRTLVKLKLDYAIVASSEKDVIFDTVYKDKVSAIRQRKALEVYDILGIFEQIKTKYNIKKCFVAPTTEALNRFLLHNKEQLEKEDIIIPLVNENLYERLSDKYSFGELCKEYGINTPLFNTDIDKANIPCVAKPYTYFNKDNIALSPQLIMTSHDKTAFTNTYDVSDFYYQKFISGESFYLLFYFDKNQRVYKYSQKNIAQQPNGKSIVAAMFADIHNEEISSAFEKMFKALLFRGIVMIEVKEENGKYYMIEANPRFWGPSQLFVDADMNLFEALLFDYNLIDIEPNLVNDKKAKYLWGGGINQCIENNTDIVYHDISLRQEIKTWNNYDIYNREDTINIYKKGNL
ncbi:MAG: ATP-grasp domain-containing protein [Bacteroidales bacterium]|jgi:predicted ATP-grasp superfamily ATP-dependent carboligase|nr:ATP-grasp domain-containing protein [Bacteroidales bacterium]